MSCEICGRNSCTRSFHSFADQDAYDARQAMSDDVDTLRREIQDLRGEIVELKAKNSNTNLLAFVIKVYNQGYKAGHHDTVDGGYVDVFDCDMSTYHEDVVREIISESNERINEHDA